MENNEKKPKRKRSFKFIIKFFQLIFALAFVFFASFFITLYINSPDPGENISSGVELVSDMFSDDEEKNSVAENSSEKISAEKTSEPVSTSSEKKNPPRETSDLTLSQRFDRLSNIEKSVNSKMLQVPNYVPLSNMPKSLTRAIVAVEDARFYDHDGYDLKGITRAAVTNLEAGEIEEGGSTITQQLAKNLFLSGEQTFWRKGEELLLAMKIEDKFPKDKILEFYLNTIYFGSNYYGIYEAAEGYFGKEPKELTLAESAMLAGLPNAPSLYSPYVNFMLAKRRQMTVIDAMLKEKIISPAEAEDARIEEIVLVRESVR